MLFRSIALIGLLLVAQGASGQSASLSLKSEALAAAKQATSFLTDHVSTEGGYLWSYSVDLSKREGEGVVETQTVWVQPPGTPAVGEAFVRLWNATHDRQFLDAAFAAAKVLGRGQMRSGGWQGSVELESDRRRKWAYRTEEPHRRAKDQSSLDDDKTQSALRFLVRLDQATGFQNENIHEMAQYGLKALLERGQFKSGGFPQVWFDQPSPSFNAPPKQANYPNNWSREYPGHKEYWREFTLNDNLASDVIDLLILAADIYEDQRYVSAANRLGHALIRAQMPDPQPAWAQQYNKDMQPIWARKFEPPAITAGESQSVIRTLLKLYALTGDQDYLAPIPKALDYLESCVLPDGQLARFYELKTNRPLYFDRDYRLTYSDEDLPTHYGFKITSNIGSLRTLYETVGAVPERSRADLFRRFRKPSPDHVRELIETQDTRGAWISEEPMRFHKRVDSKIDMAETVRHLNALASYLD